MGGDELSGKRVFEIFQIFFDFWWFETLVQLSMIANFHHTIAVDCYLALL